MTFLNAQAKNIGNDEGDVYTFFQSKLANLVQRNGGNHHFNWKTFECTEQCAPHPVGTKTYLRLTTENFEITQMEKSFITVLLDFYVKLDKSVDVSADTTNKLIRLFVGLKNAAEFFGKLDTICDNIMLKNTQDDGVREQFAYNCIKSRSQKATAKFSHSTWENVSIMSESVCGVYVPLVDIADGQPHKLSMELTIPYTDLLKYQAFQLYPNTIVGELKELVQTSMEGFVWAPLKPSIVKENLEFLDNSTIAEDIPSNVAITRKFTQIGNPATIITEYKNGTQATALDGYIKVSNGTTNGIDLKTGNVSLSITSATVQMMRSNIAGFELKPECLEGLRNFLRTPLIIPSQTLDRRHFASAARANGIDATTDISLNNATNITVMFPKRATDATCFDNIMYQNVQLYVNKHAYPDTEVSTIGARFYQMQLVANELDGTLEATKEFEDSFTDPLNDPVTGKRYANTRSDGTSFGINFQLERSNGGYVFDGIDTGTQTVPITFRGQPIYSGDNDTYYIYDIEHKDQHPPPPELWICQDTYFTMQTDGGLVYHGPNTPPGFE